MKALVTGGAGFIGSHLVDKLVDKGHEVVVVDNLSTGLESNLNYFDINVLKVSIENLPRMYQIFSMEKPDIVFHLAAHPGVPKSIENPVGTHDVNVTGTINILEAARQNGVKRVVFSSSSSIYGGTLVQPTPESKDCNPKSPYAMHKTMGEQYCKLYSKIYGLDTVSLRYFNVFGPRQRHDSPYAAVIPAFINCAKTDRRPTIYGNGEQYRDFCYVDNVVQANILVAIHQGRFDGEAFNVGCEDRITINKVHKLSGAPPAIYADKRPGDVMRSQASISKLKAIGYNPNISFEDGMRRLLEAN